MISVFCSTLVCRYQACHKRRFFTVTVTDILSRTIRFTLTGFTTQSLYYPQIIHITASKIIMAIIHLHVSFFLILSWVCQGDICKQNRKNSIKAKNKPKGVKPKMSN